MSGETFFPNPPTPILKKGRWNPFKITVFWLEVIYQAWDADETLRRELKIWHAVEYFDELGGVSSGGESLCRILDITSQAKWFNKEKLRMQKWAVFYLISKHSFSFVFSLWIIDEFEKNCWNLCGVNDGAIYCISTFWSLSCNHLYETSLHWQCFDRAFFFSVF